MHPLTVAHRRQLLGLRAVVLRDLRTLWREVDPTDRRSWERFARLAAVLLKQHHGSAVALGTRYFERLRKARGIDLPNEVTLPPLELPDEQVRKAMEATGLAGTYSALRAGKPMEQALDNGYVRAAMSAGKLVVAGSTAAVLAATRGDARARGWVRVTSAKPCSWCSSRAGTLMTSAQVFQAHDGCSCSAEPSWD